MSRRSSHSCGSGSGQRAGECRGRRDWRGSCREGADRCLATNVRDERPWCRAGDGGLVAVAAGSGVDDAELGYPDGLVDGGRIAYENGGGYVAAKHGTSAIVETLRLELAGEPIRVTEVAPGMVQTPEFSLNRFGGDQAAADKVYENVPEPLTAEDVALVMADMLELPSHINLDLVVMRPVAQAAQHKLVRGELRPKV